MGQLLFKKVFHDRIRAGTKRTTIRRWPAPRLKPGQRVFSMGLGYLRIESVAPIDLKQLTDADALADGFESRRALRKTLRELYPDAAGNRDGRRWFKVTFHFVAPAAPRRLRRREPTPDLTTQRRALADALKSQLRITTPASK